MTVFSTVRLEMRKPLVWLLIPPGPRCPQYNPGTCRLVDDTGQGKDAVPRDLGPHVANLVQTDYSGTGHPA